jgi:hypothetical protein
MTAQTKKLISRNMRAANLLPGITKSACATLRDLTATTKLSIARGEILALDGKWYITHSGLLAIARRNRCSGIDVQAIVRLSDPVARRWVVKATVYKKANERYTSYGDADPGNVSTLVSGAELRIAETRAVNRALRKAYGIALCSVEEVGFAATGETNRGSVVVSQSPIAAATSSVRNKLLALIRRHQLDAKLVKAYAEDFCGLGDLRTADCEAVTRFVENLAKWATRDHAGLVAHLERFGHEKRSSQ